MNTATDINLGDAIFADIDINPYLNELYDNILYNYSLGLFNRENIERKPVDVEAALRFADILSKSTHKKNADKHKIWAQEIVALLKAVEPTHPAIEFYMGSVLSSTGNYRGMEMITPDHQGRALLDRFYAEYSKDYMSVPADPEFQFFRSQKAVYDRLNEPCFSYSGPTSMGKSFIMRMFIKKQIMDGTKANFTMLVPTKALINEVTSKVINDLKDLLAEHNYRLVTSAGALALKQKHNFIFVLTPERLLYMLIGNPKINIDYLFIDEAHKISSRDSRSSFYYKVVDMLSQRSKRPHVIFASPNIPNPEIYLKLIPNATVGVEQILATTFTPVSQLKYLVDFPAKEIQLFNTYSSSFTCIATFTKEPSLCQLITHVGKDAQNIVYCSATAKAVDFAREYASNKPRSVDKELVALSNDIKGEIHGDYYLADVISKGVAYHIGYLPSAIRMRIEELFRKGSIKTIFSTSTLVEGVNLPADNLFITSYKNGLTKMTPVDFKNLIGRVGRIEYNLYGNVFLVRLESNIKSEEFKELLTNEIPEQKLSVVTELSKPQKKLIIQSLVAGNIELLRHPKNQTNDEYALMRKFAIILLRDITKGNNSLVRKEFAVFLDDSIETSIKQAFEKTDNPPDDDINVSVDQTNNLTVAIAKGLQYPTLDANGHVEHRVLFAFLEKLCGIFKWEKYEQKTLGKVGKNKTHGMLSWYTVILAQWVSGSGLSFIIDRAIQYKIDNPQSGVMIGGKLILYSNSLEHRNIVISETLGVIENVILFSISNYFLRFSSEYKRFHKVDSFQNDWYEYVEYGTTNSLSILLQRNGFSRETSTYIRTHKTDYVVTLPDGELKLRRSLLDCPSVSVCKEAADIQYNIPELFVDEDEQAE
jgi:hypothetical protein